MQAQDAATAYFFKLWEWVENNVKTVVIGAIIVVIAIVVICYYFWQQDQTEVAAGQALTQLLVSTPPNSDATQLANAYLKIAADFPDTQAGDRALVLGAATLYASGKYTEAESQFKNYLGAHPAGTFAATAALGVAASLDARGETNSAAGAYQRVVANFSDPNAVDAAKFALARMDEQQGKLADAANYYQEIMRDNPNSPLGAEARLRLIQLKSKQPATLTTKRAVPTVKPATATTNLLSVPFNLSTKP